MNLRNSKTVKERRNLVENSLGVDLKSMGNYPRGLEAAQFTNCENMIGAAQIPVGIAGPIFIKGQYAAGEFYLPLATTEGALVASVNRGCKAISQSGGVTVRVENTGVTRGPVFQTSGVIEGFKFKKWLKENIAGLQAVAARTSGHIALIKIGARIAGKNVFVRFYFDTREAMGMNMATIAVAEITQYIEEKTGIKCISTAGNFDVDKKASWLNVISGRGKQVWAEAIIPAEVLKQTLKTTSPKIYDVWLSKCMLGSAMSGSMGFNAHFANVVAAVFLATGQDVAHTVEGSLGFTTTQLDGENLYICVYLPDLMVGTVGGGTGLPSQEEALSMLGIAGENKSSFKLAEIIGAAVLAGEVSLLASLSEGSLAAAHQNLARKPR